MDRVNNYMNNEELDPSAVSHEPSEKEPVIVRDGEFKWGKGEKSILQDINLSIKEGSLTAVVGSVGSGKSSLLSALLGGLLHNHCTYLIHKLLLQSEALLLGDMEKENGHVNVQGKVAYVPQQAWMQVRALHNYLRSFSYVLNTTLHPLLQNATLEENVLFSKRMNVDNYDRIIEACALRSDIDILPGGDQV